MFPAGQSPPPSALPGTPVDWQLPAGTNLYRVHSKKYAAVQFNPVAPKSPYDGGRFDSKSDGDPYLYAGDSAECAIGEVWDRDLGPSREARVIPVATLRGRRLSELRTNVDLRLIDVGTPAASQFGQTSWFTHCEPHEYVFTREWADWLRRMAPGFAGFAWRSKRDSNRFSFVLYETQLPTGSKPFRHVQSNSTERDPTRALVEQVMAQHGAVFKTSRH